MNCKKYALLLSVLLSIFLFCGGAAACTWAAFANGKAAFVVRTVDWYYDDDSPIYGVGRNVAVKAADTPNAMEYTTRYASIQIEAFAKGQIADAINEKGLQGSILFLDDSLLPPTDPGKKDVHPGRFLAYAVSNFATVQEVVDNLKNINFIPAALDLPYPDSADDCYAPENWPGHYAFADAGGDKAIIEFIKGEVKVYHGREHDAMTNEPWYEIHLLLDSIGYPPNGSIGTVDRRSRAKLYLRDMYERGVSTPGRALMAMRGLLASVFAGTEEIDRSTEDNEVYPTFWGAIVDLNQGVYYLSRTKSWCSEIYDFTMFSPDAAETVVLKPEDCPYADRDIIVEAERP